MTSNGANVEILRLKISIVNNIVSTMIEEKFDLKNRTNIIKISRNWDKVLVSREHLLIYCPKVNLFLFRITLASILIGLNFSYFPRLFQNWL